MIIAPHNSTKIFYIVNTMVAIRPETLIIVYFLLETIGDYGTFRKHCSACKPYLYHLPQ